MKKKNYLSNCFFETKKVKETMLRNRNEAGVSVSSSLVQERINQVAKIKSKNILALLQCLFLFGAANLFTQVPTPINNANWNWFATTVHVPNTHFELEENIGDPANPITQMVIHPFQCYFFGNGHRIYVEIESDSANVGLFSQIGAGGQIENLIIDGFVTGGLNSQNVGGLVGLIGNRTAVQFVTNRAQVVCISNTASVGGIAGTSYSIFSALENSGNVTGGQYVGGIAGRTLSFEDFITVRVCKNSGTIRSESVNYEGGIYIAGIVAYSSGHMYMHSVTNIGKILGNNATYSAGLVAYLTHTNIDIDSSGVYSSSNAGIVTGSINSTIGGLFGYVSNRVNIVNCINTNWVEPIPAGGTGFAGAIVGNNNGQVISCFFDEQMCVVAGIGNGIIAGATGMPTNQMIGNNLQFLFVSNHSYVWRYHPNLYPRPSNNSYSFTYPDHPIELLSAAPIYLQNNETVDNVRTDFFVSNYWSLVPPLFALPRIEQPYQWNSLSNGGIISIPMWNLGNNATIIGRGQDTLRVILMNDPLYEKLVPIWAR